MKREDIEKIIWKMYDKHTSFEAFVPALCDEIMALEEKPVGGSGFTLYNMSYPPYGTIERTKQAADRALIDEEVKRKNRLRAFWDIITQEQ